MQSVSVGWGQDVPKRASSLAPDHDKEPRVHLALAEEDTGRVGLLTLGSSLRRNWRCGDNQ